jgi:hypothetical protein
VYALLAATPGLAEAGYDPESIQPNFTPDGPSGDRFLVLRWGTTTVGIAPVHQVRLQVWAYNRQPDFAPISSALKLIRTQLATLESVVMAPGESVLAVRFEGDSDDLYDDGYRAHTRWCSHLITASGS